MEYARQQPGARYFVTFDADGQHQVKDVIRMVQRLRTEPLDIIVGTRFGRPKSDHDQVPWIKRLVLQTVVLLSRKTRHWLSTICDTISDACDIPFIRILDE